MAWLSVETTVSDLTPEKQRALDALMGSLQRMAMKVIEAPISEREAVYELMEESLVETAQELQMEDDFRKQYMTWLRAMVSIIESGGGTQRGTA
jgi:transcription elongation GreA/GreB family factor